MSRAWVHRISIVVALVVGVVVGVVGACGTNESDKPSGSVTSLTDPPDAVELPLMIALLQAKNFHHKAKVYMSDGNLVEATASVRQILSLRFPPGAPEAEDVRLDARALLAKLLVSQGQLEEAMRTVDEGLAQATRESFFVANLYTVQGEIHDARAETFKTQNDNAKTVEAHHAAIVSYDRSIQINNVLLEKLMGGVR